MHHCILLLAVCTVAVVSVKELGDFRPRPLGPIVIAPGPKISGAKAPIARDPSRTIGPIVILPGTSRPKPAHDDSTKAEATTAKIARDPSRTIGTIIIGPGPKITGTKATPLARDSSRTIGPIVIMPGTARPKH